MNEKILVVYASKTGVTEEIASFISKQLNAAGFETDMCPADEVSRPDRYHTVVIGTPVYMGKWLPQATQFVRDYHSILKNKSLFVFLSGLSFSGKADPEKLKLIEQYSSREYALIHPKHEACFAGKLDYSRLSFFHKIICKMIKAPAGDFRNWEEIKSWTDIIMADLQS